MRVKDFVSIILKPFWKWSGLFMDLLGIVIYIKPDLTDRLSFSKLFQIYWWVWVLIGTVIWTFATAWQYAKEKAEIRKLTLEKSKPETSQNNRDGGIGFQNAVFNAPVNISQPKSKKSLIMLDSVVQEVVESIIVYKAYDDKNLFVKRKINNLAEFHKNNISEMSPALDKLIYYGLLPEAKKVTSIIERFWEIFIYRKGALIQKVSFDNFPDIPIIDNIEKDLLDFRDKIHEEIYRVLNT